MHRFRTICEQHVPDMLVLLFASRFGKNFFGSAVLAENGFGSDCPCEWFRILVSMLNPFLDCGFELRDVVENASPYSRVISAKSRSTRLNQEQDVGVKCRMKRLCLASQRFTAGALWVA
jgi:hypothetical protein